MSRITTTKKINETLTNNLLHIGKVEVYYKTSGKTETIDADAFQKSLGFLCETIFADCIGWHYERDINTGQYIAECSRKDGNSDLIIIAHLCACDSVNVEDVEKMLKIEEE